jgi:hypothetical protein
MNHGLPADEQHIVETFGKIDTDPNGKAANEPGAKLDSGKNQVGLVIHGFARALNEVSKVGTFGAVKYTAMGWVSVPDAKIRYTDAMYRHFLKEASGEEIDQESKLLHAAHGAWNALARLDILLREAEQNNQTN